MLNVDVTPGGKSVKKRQGFGLDTTFTYSTTAVHGTYKFFDANGNEVRLAGQDVGLYASVSGAAWVRVATGTLSATWQCTDWLGQAYCVTSARDTPVRTDGTVSGTSYQPTIPAGTTIASTADRLLVGNTASNPSRIYYSGSTNFTDFTLGTLVTSSSFEDMTAPGSQITHLAYHYGYWMWWKDQSFGFITGTDQTNLVIQTVSDTVGTFDNTDIFWQGIDYFRGTDAHIYAYDGATLNPMTRDITPTVTSANRRKSNSWVQSSALDFNAGFALYTDTTTNPGSVTLSGKQDSFSSLANWSVNTGWTDSSGFATTTTEGAKIFSALPSSTTFNWNFYARFSFPTNPSFPGQTINFILMDSTGNGYYFYIQDGNGSNRKSIFLYTASNGVRNSFIGTAGGNGSIIIDDNQIHYINLTRSFSGQFTITSDSTTKTGSPSVTLGTDSTYLYISSVAVSYTSAPGGQANLYQYSLQSSTGIYYSAVDNAPNLTNWGTFGATYQDNGGINSFFVRSSSNIFAITSSTPAWTAITPGAIPIISTGTGGAYFQMKDSFTVTSATQTPTLNDFTFNWYEGTASDKMYGTYFDYGLWFSVSLGTVSYNNRILRYDLLNQIWTLYDIPANGFLTYNNSLYFGSSSVGKLYKFGSGVTSDEGAAINSYYKTKDYFGVSPFNDNDMRTISWYAKESSGTLLNITYQVNESTQTTYSLNLFDPNSNSIRNNRNFPSGTAVRTINFKFGDNSTNPLWEIFAGDFTFVPRPWNATGP